MASFFDVTFVCRVSLPRWWRVLLLSCSMSMVWGSPVICCSGCSTFCKSISAIGVKCAVSQMLYFVIESSEVVVSRYPSFRVIAFRLLWSTALMIQSLFFTLDKMSRFVKLCLYNCVILPSVSWLGSLYPASAIQRYARNGEVLNIFVSIRNEALPSE